MSKYLFQGKYVGKGIAGLMKEGGTARRAAAEAALSSVGCQLESMYYAFGDTDVVGIVECPDQASAVAASLLINSSGAVELNMTPLMTAEDIDDAMKMKGTYHAPGQ